MLGEQVSMVVENYSSCLCYTSHRETQRVRVHPGAFLSLFVVSLQKHIEKNGMERIFTQKLLANFTNTMNLKVTN